jgi:hypothetical protein
MYQLRTLLNACIAALSFACISHDFCPFIGTIIYRYRKSYAELLALMKAATAARGVTKQKHPSG